jgi:cytochrome c oxidase subunit II
VSGRFPVLRPYTADAVGLVQTKTRRRLRRLAVLLPVAVGGALVLAPAASAGWFLPQSDGSPNADAIRTLYILIALIALVIFIGVEGLLIYSLLRFRARKGRIAAQIHGNTQLEIGWTVGAAAILIFLTVFTFVLLDDVKNPAASEINAEGDPVAAGTLYAATDQPSVPKDSASMNIRVVGQQYSWTYYYPEAEGQGPVYAYNDMYVPVGMTVTLDVQSSDVVHSWWIPQLGGKMDAVPGYTNKTWFRIPLDAIPEG